MSEEERTLVATCSHRHATSPPLNLTLVQRLGSRTFLGNVLHLTGDLDLCCCSARIRVACCLGEPPAAPDIWGA